MLPSARVSSAWLFPWWLLAIAPGCWGEGPVVYVGTGDQAVEFSVSTPGPFFAELSGGEWRGGDATYAAVRVGARTSGKNVLEISAGQATVSDCSQRLGDSFVPSYSLGTGYAQGPLLLMFHIRYIRRGERPQCSAAGADASEVISLAGIAYRF